MTNNNDTSEIISVPGLIRNKIYKKLIFKSEGLTIEKPLSFDPPVFIAADDICAFRFGVNWIRGYAFTIGRQYVIQLEDSHKKTYDIKFSSYYTIRRKLYTQVWLDIFDKLWVNYFHKRFSYYYDLYHKKQTFDLVNVKFHPFGISWDDRSLFWNEIALSNYKTYFVIHHREDLKKTKSCSFKNDWNAIILQHLLKEIIKEHDSYRASDPA